jgi:lysophospholipase L1-like esterase
LYFKEQLHRFLVSRSVLYYYFEKLVYRLGGKKLPFLQPHNLLTDTSDQPANWLAKTWTKETEENVDYTMSILGLTIKLLQEKGVKVVLTGVPHAPQFSGEWSSRPHEALGETAQKYGIPYLNSYEKILTESKLLGINPVLLYWREDPTHLNIEGNAVWGKIQLEFLLENKEELLP